MIIILPLLFTWIILILTRRLSNFCLLIYILLINLLYNLLISIGLNYFELIITIFVIIFLIWNKKNDIIYLYSILFQIGIILIFNCNSLLSLFISIEYLSFLMITFINLYIQDKYSGILYYLFSGLFSAIFILSLGYLYLGYTIAYYFISLVFIFKLGLGPLHILLPNIYNSISLKKLIYLDIMNKYLLFYIFYRLILSIPINLYFIILITILIGLILIIKEYNLLNILIYSSLINYGLILISMSELSIFYIYLFIYSIITFLYIYLIIHIWPIYSYNNNWYILLWSILLLNMIGIPPLNGFWIKFYVLELLLHINYTYYLFFIILISLIFLSSIYIRILLSFIINDKILNIEKLSISHSHFISSLILFLSFPLFI